MQYLVFSFLLTTILVVAICFIVYTYWKFKKVNYTRERYAFKLSAISLTLTLTILPVLIGGNSWLNLAFELLNKIFKLQLPPVQLGISDRILLLILYLAPILLMYLTYSSWTGEKSIRQNKEEKERESGSIVRDLIALIRDVESTRKYNPENEPIIFDINFPKEEELSWPQKAALYMNLLEKQLKILPEKDWHSQQSCYISSYSTNGDKYAILVSLHLPSDSKIINFINFSKNYVVKGLTKLIVLVKNENSARKIKEYMGYDVEFRFENELLNSLVDFSEYAESIKNQFESQSIIQGYNYTLSQVYTDPSCVVKERFANGNISLRKISNFEDYVTSWLEESTEQRHIALLAEYGQGKSVLALRICNQIFTSKIETTRIPIIIELRGKYPRQYSDIIKFFADWGSKYGIDPNALYRLHLAGKLLIIFEGFDEMDLVGDYSIRLDHFRKLWEFSYPNSKIIITGRPNYFINETELKTILKTSSSKTSLPYCEEVYIEMFDRNRIEKSLRNTDPEVRNDILEILDDPNTNRSFVDLISRPALLFLTSIVWKDRKLYEFKKNINSATVIGEFVKQTYERQESKEIKTPLSSIERSYFMMGIAVGMVQSSGYTNQIDLARLKDILTILYTKFPDDLSKNDISKNPTTSKRLSERFDERYNFETVFADIRSCGLLVRDLSTFDSYKFAHKSFLEYLVSLYYTNSLIEFKENVNDKIITKTIYQALKLDLASIDKSKDVFRFIIQLISKLIDFNNLKNDQKKVKKIFELVYPYRWINYKIVLALVPFCGRDLKSAFRYFFYFILAAGAISLILYFLSRDQLFFTRPHFTIIFVIFLLLYCFPVYFENYRPELSANQGSKKSTLSKMAESMFFYDHNNVLDPGNLNLWFQTCIEIGIKEDFMSQHIPRKTFRKLRSNYHSFFNNEEKKTTTTIHPSS